MVQLTDLESHTLTDKTQPAFALAMRIIVETAKILDAPKLIPITSAHIDGCLYHGDSGVYFAEFLVELGAKVSVPTTLNVGALDLIHPDVVKFDSHSHTMAKRQMQAYLAMNCQASWTCAPYQAGHRPAFGEDIAWGESNAVVFTNSVLGARTNRYGDLLDICLALVGRAPYYGLHIPENRQATLIIDLESVPQALKLSESFYPVLGSWLGHHAGTKVSAIIGVDNLITEDRLKALGAGAASTGSVGLFHIIGQTPEAPTLDAICLDIPNTQTLAPTAQDLRLERDRLSHSSSDELDCIAVGSPHFSYPETIALLDALQERKSIIPFYVCTNRFVLTKLEHEKLLIPLKAAGIEIVVDTCIAVAPILKGTGGVMMTNSAKFAHYGPGMTGYVSVFGSLSDCVESAITGKIIRDDRLWQ
jgi:predicted aconitase